MPIAPAVIFPAAQSNGNVTSLASGNAVVDTTTGDMIVVAVTGLGGSLMTAPTFTVTDAQSNTYTAIAGSRQTFGLADATELFYAKNITGGSSNSITVTPSESSQVTFQAVAFSGADATAPFDGNANSGSGTGTSASSGDVTVPAGSSMVFGFVGYSSNSASASDGVFTGTFVSNLFSSAGTADADSMGLGYSYATGAGGTGHFPYTLSSVSTAWGAAIASFKDAVVTTTRGMPFGAEGTAFAGGRCLVGIVR